MTYNGSKIGIVNPGQASLLTPKGTEFANMGTRGQRFAIVVNDGVATNVEIEAPKEFKVSSAEYILSKL